MTQWNVTAMMGWPLTDDESHLVFTELAHLHPGIGFSASADAHLILTVDDAHDAAAA